LKFKAQNLLEVPTFKTALEYRDNEWIQCCFLGGINFRYHFFCDFFSSTQTKWFICDLWLAKTTWEIFFRALVDDFPTTVQTEPRIPLLISLSPDLPRNMQ